MASGALHTRVDYIDGDPAEPGPIEDGTLALDSDGLHFSCHGKEELHAGLEDLRGITVSGSGGQRHKVRSRHHSGTTRLAVSRDERPMVWEFALDRTKGVLLREWINRELAGAGRPPLPYVEALYDFEPAVDPVFAEKPPAPLRTEHREIDRDAWFRQKRFIFALVALMVLLEIGVPLLILFVF
jgi:hypothetical protein